MKFKTKLLMLLIENDVTGKDLAEDTGIAWSTIYHYKKGDAYPSFTTLSLLADYFNISLSELLKDVDKNI